MKPLDLSKPYEEALAVFLSTHLYSDVCIDGANYHYVDELRRFVEGLNKA